MYIIVHNNERRRGFYSDENPAFRKAYHETLEQIEGRHPRSLSPERRLEIKKMRFQGKKPELVARSAAIRDYMTKEINR